MKSSKQNKIYKIGAALAALFVLCMFLLPAKVWAASDEVHSVDIVADLQQDGSALVTEKWHITVENGGEWYVVHELYDNITLSGLTVTDETGRVFETIDDWDSDRSRNEKAYQAGILETNDGYELCWGFGEYGEHTYTVQYTLHDLIKSYPDADAITFRFLEAGRGIDAEKVSVTIRAEGMQFTSNDTGVWAAGFKGDIHVVNGQVLAQSKSAVGEDRHVDVMVEFNKGMFTPQDARETSFADIKAEALEGSDYRPGIKDSQGWHLLASAGNMLREFLPLIVMALVALVGVASASSKYKSGVQKQKMKQEYKDPPYSRNIPYNGNVLATSLRLEELNQLPDDGTLIGAYLLRWVRSKQVDLVPSGKKDEVYIVLRQPRPEMAGPERTLYDMLVAAAGPDYTLQPKEFERWSKKNYNRVQGWMTSCQNAGKAYMRQAGLLAQQQVKTLGVFTTTKEITTPAGEQATIEMFGFEKYLEEFTIINEREAREVQLWDEYLVFAQLFGIADKVGEQFEKLYPGYFQQMMGQTAGSGTFTMYDYWLLNSMMRSYSRAMTTGYRAGYRAAQAAHNSRYTGGGGGSSFGGFGGGGFSGGGGGGGGSR